MRTISVEAFHNECKAQGVSSRKHIAVVCPVCKTVQSIASLEAAGADEIEAKSLIGFSCIGRTTGAGPFKRKDRSQPGKGCDWTLGGLFRIHELEVVTEDGKHHPHFELASSAQAADLEARAALSKAEGLSAGVEDGR